MRTAFPSLSESEIAQLALMKCNNTRGGRSPSTIARAEASLTIPTVAEIVGKMRDKYRRKETRRIRALVQPDGSIKVKDTTTYRTHNTHNTHNTHWKKLVEMHGGKLERLGISQLSLHKEIGQPAQSRYS